MSTNESSQNLDGNVVSRQALDLSAQSRSSSSEAPLIPNRECVIELNSAHAGYRSREVLTQLNLRVEKGEIVGIVGRNGAGKTTLIDLICGLQTPTKGSIVMFGEKSKHAVNSRSTLARPSALFRSRIGVLPQETALYADLTADQNLKFAATLYAVKNKAARIAEVLELVGLSDRRLEPVKTFSGGMQRRLAIARALLHDPELLILDEPTVGVDAQTRHQIWNYIRRLKLSGKTVVFTTNYLDEAEALCDRVVMLNNGKIAAIRSPASLALETGTCLEIVGSGDFNFVMTQLAEAKDVKRVERKEAGLLIYLGSGAKPEELVLFLRTKLVIQSFRTRSPDLAEIFQHFTGTSLPPELGR